MATPTGSERRALAAGFKKSSTWGTAVALGAGDGALLKGLSGLIHGRDYLPAKEADTPFVLSGVMGDIKPVDFTLAFDARYDPTALGVVLALMFGTAGAPTQQGGTAAYKHIFQWADTLSGKFGTFCAEYPGKIFEVASAKALEFSLKGSSGIIQGEAKLRGNTVIDTSATNTATQIDALTYADRENRIAFSHSSVKINAQSGGDVTGETALECNSWEVNYKRGGDGVNVAGSASIIEPAEGDHPEITVKLGFPRMNSVNAAFLATFIAGTTQKLLLKCTGALIAGSYYYDLAMYFPRLRMTKPDASWEEIVKNGLELSAEQASANPTGMSYTRPYIELINLRTTDYLT
jgi:hypothetical protein